MVEWNWGRAARGGIFEKLVESQRERDARRLSVDVTLRWHHGRRTRARGPTSPERAVIKLWNITSEITAKQRSISDGYILQVD